VGEVSKRRWGRGLKYFYGRASAAGQLDISSIIAPDIIEFLSDRHGLKRDGQSQPATVRDAMEALEFECRRIVKEDPVHCFTWGMIRGGDSPQGGFVEEFIHRAKAAEPIDGADFAINLVVQIAGPMFQPDWSGVQVTRTSVERRTLLANVAPTQDMQQRELEDFLVGAMHKSVEGAERSIRRRKVAWSTEPHRAMIAMLTLQD